MLWGMPWGMRALLVSKELQCIALEGPKSGILLALNTQGQAEDGLIARMRNHRLPQQCSPRHAAKFVSQNLLWNANEAQ